MADNLGADPAFVASQSSRQGVSTKGFNRGEWADILRSLGVGQEAFIEGEANTYRACNAANQMRRRTGMRFQCRAAKNGIEIERIA